MLCLTYLDAYQTPRTETYESLEAMKLAFAGCVTLPDYYRVVSVTYNEKDLGYTGLIGDLYQAMQGWSELDDD